VTLASPLPFLVNEGARVEQTYTSPPPSWGPNLSTSEKVTGTMWQNAAEGARELIVHVDSKYGSISRPLLLTSQCDHITIEGLPSCDDQSDSDASIAGASIDESVSSTDGRSTEVAVIKNVQLSIKSVQAAFAVPEQCVDYRLLHKAVPSFMHPEHGLNKGSHNAIAIGAFIQQAARALKHNINADLKSMAIEGYELPSGLTHLSGVGIDTTEHPVFGKCMWNYLQCNIRPFLKSDADMSTRKEIILQADGYDIVHGVSEPVVEPVAMAMASMKAVAHSSKVIEDVLGINNNVSLFQNTGASAVATLAYAPIPTVSIRGEGTADGKPTTKTRAIVSHQDSHHLLQDMEADGSLYEAGMGKNTYRYHPLSLTLHTIVFIRVHSQAPKIRSRKQANAQARSPLQSVWCHPRSIGKGSVCYIWPTHH
jgi:hypothetical protein